MIKENNKKFNALFIIGLPNNKLVKVVGYNKQGQLEYVWDGNCDFHSHIKIEKLNINLLPIIWHNNNLKTIPDPDIIINCINDADISSKSLEISTNIVNSLKNKKPDLKIFNNPERIYNTTRDKIYDNYHHLNYIKIPKTIKIKPNCVEEVFIMAKKNNIFFPFLIRKSGAHQSYSLQKINNKKDAIKLEKYQFDGSEFYITKFIDYKNNQDLYQKCRLVIIDGQILPRHFMTSNNWLVHGDLHQTLMAKNREFKDAEEYFLKNYQKMISKESLESLIKIYQDIGLDYLGFDFAIMPDGKLLIFEINSAQNAFLNLDYNNFAYMKEVRENIVKALNIAIEKRL